MQRVSHTTTTEGNGVWFAFRVTLPDGNYLEQADVETSGTVVEVTLTRTTNVGAAKQRFTVLQLTGANPQTNLDRQIFDTLQFAYWDGYDDIGYNFLYFLPPTGTDVNGAGYTLEGGNDYRVEFLVKTKAVVAPPASQTGVTGDIRWAANLHIDGLEAL